jgi:hypothetical protein
VGLTALVDAADESHDGVARRFRLNAQIMLGKSMFTVRGADHLHVAGDLVEIQRATPTGYETVAVAGEDLLVTIEPAERTGVAGPNEGVADGTLWQPVGEPMD